MYLPTYMMNTYVYLQIYMMNTYMYLLIYLSGDNDKFEITPHHIYDRTCGESKVVYDSSDNFNLPTKITYIS